MTKVGLQLYTVREHLEQDFEGTLRKIAGLGYQGVEFAGYYGRTKEEVRSLLEETGLAAIGTHTSLDRLKNHLQEEIEFNKFIGNRNLVIPYVIEEDRSRWPEIIADIRNIGEACAAEDMVLLYHNHDFELTQKLEDRPVLDAIYEQVPASLVQVELDSCWVHYAGYDPVEYVRKYTSRLLLLHLKDVKRREDGSPETVELGAGEVDVKRIADAGIAAGVKWLIVEQDFSAKGALDSISISMDWLKAYQTGGGNIHV
ncbi:sugar phosphate isomerase/epimerase family protein [Paenibacillus caui]|uniref:sugar phosphate isomerase/epimerase family protein n=1 Tax=Paenibacillus caui TaxID=2873927 RepID=UPI001CAA3654|nr:TIM barrel protein [Paenibacillus caui]